MQRLLPEIALDLLVQRLIPDLVHRQLQRDRGDANHQQEDQPSV